MTTALPITETSRYSIDLRLGRREPRARNAPLPKFLRMLHAVLESAPQRVTCVVMPRPEDVAFGLAVSASLDRFRSHLDNALAEYASTQFREGELVCVLPNGLVYEFAGYFPQSGRRFFKLRVLDRTDGLARACEATEILRLQRTTRRSPKGKQNTDLGKIEPSPLDHLLGVRTLGNASLFRNEVLLLASRPGFECFLGNLVTPGSEQTISALSGAPTLDSVLPWGTIAEDGALRMHNGGDGTPICAIASNAQRVRSALESLPSDSAWVIVAGAHRLANMEELHTIAEMQRVLIVAGPSEIEDIEHLRRAGIVVWQPEVEDLLIDSETSDAPVLCADVLRAVKVMRDLSLQSVSVQDNLLSEAAADLRQAEAHISTDVQLAARETVGACFGLLMELSEWFMAPGREVVEETTNRLDAAAHRLRMVSHFLPPSVSASVSAALQKLARFIVCFESNDAPKMQALASLLDQFKRRGKRPVIVVRTARCAERLREHVSKRWPNATIARARIPEGIECDAIILGSWPRQSVLDEIVGSCVTPDIRLLAYDHEKRWLSGYVRKRALASAKWRISGEDRKRILGLPATAPAVSAAGAIAEGANRSLDDLLSAFRLESFRSHQRKGGSADPSPLGESLEAQYVGFCGRTYAYLTPRHRVPRLNALLQGDRRVRSAVEQVTVDDLRPGDFILFRGVGDSDVISLIAEQIYGSRYTEARKLAEEWRPVLRRIGTDSSTVHKQLRRRGLTQQAITVQGWMRDPSRIGPQNESDLRIIADAARDRWLLDHSHEVFEAIRDVRGAHVQAGSRLTEILLEELPAKLAHIGEEETRLELTFGDVWVVQVEDVSTSMELRSYMDVNRLIWDVWHD